MKRIAAIFTLALSCGLYASEIPATDLITTAGRFYRAGTKIDVVQPSEDKVTLAFTFPNSEKYETSEKISANSPFWILWDSERQQLWLATSGAFKRITFSPASTSGVRYSLKEGLKSLSPPTILRSAIESYLKNEVD